jgi:hypothetical protein
MTAAFFAEVTSVAGREGCPTSDDTEHDTEHNTAQGTYEPEGRTRNKV